MFCSNCGKEITDGMRFCPACGAAVGSDVGAGAQVFGQPEVQRKGISVEKDFETLRQVIEKGNRSEKVWKNIGKILAFLYLLLMARGFVNSVKEVLNGDAGIWYIISGMAAMILIACGLAYVFTEIVLPAVKVKKTFYAEEYLKFIHVENGQDLMKALEQLKCSAVKRTYMDENGKVCVQGRKNKHTFESREGELVLISEKDNYKAALERETIAGSLLKFLAPDAPVNAYEKEQDNARLSRMNKVLAVFALISGALVIFGIVNPDGMEGQQKYIRMIKETAPQAYPDITYGEAFEAFFGDDSWNYFKSTDEQDVVEFHGKCQYDGEEAEVTIQYLVSYEEGTLQLYTMAINDEPQTEFVQLLMLEKIFESYEAGDGSQNLELEDLENETNTDVETGMDTTEKKSDTETNGDAGKEDVTENPELAQDMAEYTSGIMFPILSRGYEDSGECPVMVTEENESGDDLESGTYEEMLASCINDGITMYASPNMYGGCIYTATKWDASTETWYDGLLTYDQFLSVVKWMCQTYSETGTDNIYTSASWEDLNALSGKWSDGDYRISLSVYSDASFYNAYDEVGTFSIEETGVSGKVQLLGESNGNLSILCETADGAEMELYYISDGRIEVKSVSDKYGIGEHTYLTCIERFES